MDERPQAGTRELGKISCVQIKQSGEGDHTHPILPPVREVSAEVKTNRMEGMIVQTGICYLLLVDG